MFMPNVIEDYFSLLARAREQRHSLTSLVMSKITFRDMVRIKRPIRLSRKQYVLNKKYANRVHNIPQRMINILNTHGKRI